MSDLRTHIEAAIQLAGGSQQKLAQACRVSQQQISYLLKSNTISAEMALKIDSATEGQVSRHVLRPDIFGEEARAN
jgi:DNA-binding transcriptional regulator YdaS (Cro superfamily)